MSLKSAVYLRLFSLAMCAGFGLLHAQSTGKISPVKKKKTAVKPVKKKAAPEEEIEIGMGDTALIGKPPMDGDKVSGIYYHLDIYRKTRWDPDAPGYDTATGNGFYQAFFKGDFDAAELPSTYAGKKLVVLGVEVLKNKNTGKDMYIMYLHSDVPNTVIWVDFYEAMATGEISFIPKKRKK